MISIARKVFKRICYFDRFTVTAIASTSQQDGTANVAWMVIMMSHGDLHTKINSMSAEVIITFTFN